VNEASPANSAAAADWRSGGDPPERDFAPERDDAIFDMMELFFFAYRDFVKDADRLLEKYKFGRAHHRVLHFVNRRPGLAIAALLDILKITKQSLNRVLKQLLDGGFVEAREGANDRRQRLLYTSPKGAALARELARLQSARFVRVLSGLSPDARGSATEFLLAMIDEDDRARVRAHLLIAATARPAGEEAPP
jgi:DNA-binding MarR family transcriptional regulator